MIDLEKIHDRTSLTELQKFSREMMMFAILTEAKNKTIPLKVRNERMYTKALQSLNV